MNGKTYTVIGLLLALPSAALFIMDFTSLHSYILYGLAALAYIGSILAGRKLAMHVHDLHLARRQNRKISPSMVIYAWLSMFVLFIIIYTIAKIALGYFVKILFLPLGGTYISLIYNPLALVAFYLIFSGRYQDVTKFLTMWGKASIKAEKATKTAPAKMMSAPAKGTEFGMNAMNNGMDMLKKVKKK